MNKKATSRLFCVILSAGVMGATVVAVAKPKKGGGGGGGQSNSGGGQTYTPPTSAPSGGNQSAIDQDIADLNAAEQTVKQTFETSSQWINAQGALKQAQQEYKDACGPVLDNLKSNSDYQTALDAVSKADANLKDMQNTGSHDDISEAAQTDMQAKSALKDLETKALQTDPITVAAQQKVNSANQAVAQLRQQEVDAIHADPTWQAAKKKLDADRGK